MRYELTNQLERLSDPKAWHMPRALNRPTTVNVGFHSSLGFPKQVYCLMKTCFSLPPKMGWIGFFIGLLFHLAFCQDNLTNHGYNDSANTYFTYHKFSYENCESATKCPLMTKILRNESMENVLVCHMNETIIPLCPIPEDNICICVKEGDCQEIHDILDPKNTDMQKKHDVNKNYQSCGFEDSIPKYCCPYQKINSIGKAILI